MLALGVAAGLILAWDVVIAGHIAQMRSAPRPLAALAGLAALLAAPALLIAVATNSTITGHSVAGVAWIWPLTILIFAVEAMYTTVRRLVTPYIGIPITIYNIVLFIVAITRYVEDNGGAPAGWALSLAAACVNAIGSIAGPLALASPYAVFVPLVTPAFPARLPLSRPTRAVLALFATVSVTAIAAWLPAATSAVASYDRYLPDRLQERPAGDFTIGIRLLPPLDAVAPSPALRNDLALVDTTGAGAVSVIIDPDGARAPALDSLARVFDALRRDSTTVFVTLGYPRGAARQYRRSPREYERSRIDDLQRIARRLHPDFILPADEPYGRGADVIGRLPVAVWTHYLTAAAAAVHAVDPHIKVAVASAAFDARDSALYAWAAASGSPIDAVGFTFFPAFDGAATLDARMRTADRWMRLITPPLKDQWVFAAGGYPAAHGEEAQQLAIWAAFVWGTSRATVKGVIAAEAADYGTIAGLRAPSGRLRPAALLVMRASRELRQN